MKILVSCSLYFISSSWRNYGFLFFYLYEQYCLRDSATETATTAAASRSTELCTNYTHFITCRVDDICALNITPRESQDQTDWHVISPQPMYVSFPPLQVRTQSPPATQQASVLFALRPSRWALAVGDDKLPALPPPQIPPCLSKYPPRSHREWHSDSECDRGCTCVRPYVCVWLAIAGFWQEVNNRNTHFRLIGTSPQCQRRPGWWCWISSKCFCRNFYVRGKLCAHIAAIFMRGGINRLGLCVTVWLQELLG